MNKVSLLLIILLLGCTGSSGVEPIKGMTSDGISILRAELTRQEVEAGDDVDLLLQIQNTGAANVQKLEAKLIRHGSFTVLCSGGQACEDTAQIITKLSPPDLRLNTEGEVSELFWTLTPEAVSTPVDKEFSIKISYDYMSEATQEIPILSKDRLDEIRIAGDEVAPGSSTRTEGPIKVSIKTPEYEIAKEKSDDAKEGLNTFNFEILLENIGKGAVRSESAPPMESWCAEESLNCVDEVEVTLSGAHASDVIECENYSAEMVKKSSKSVVLELIKLWQGDTARISCQMTVAAGQTEEYPIITATASYQYSIDAPLSVHVVPSRG